MEHYSTHIPLPAVDAIRGAARLTSSHGSMAAANEDWRQARCCFRAAYDLLATIGEDQDDIVDKFADDMPFEQW